MSAIAQIKNATYPLFVGEDLLTIPMPRQLVMGRLVEGSLVFFVGESGVGKTFVMLDLALAIACGLKEWLGAPIPKDIRGRPVVYILGEGAGMVKVRIAAVLHDWCKQGLIASPDIPKTFVFAKQRLELDHDGTVKLLIDELEALKTRPIEPLEPVVIFVDTWQRHGGPESDDQEMRKAIERMDRLREATGAAVAIAHHTPKDGRATPRGHGSLDGSADTVVQMHTTDAGEIKLNFEQRDLEPSFLVVKLAPFTFDPTSVFLQPWMLDEYGQPRKTCVVELIPPAQVTHVAAKTKAKVVKEDKRIEQLWAYVNTNPGCSVTDLRNHLSVSSSWVSKTVADLVSTGNLRRETIPGNGANVKTELFTVGKNGGQLPPLAMI